MSQKVTCPRCDSSFDYPDEAGLSADGRTTCPECGYDGREEGDE